mmetsp:Transcript_17939/g.44797  ORF Transcript_17939/g.44797 Transcript_17939/m.44797 type:complete len:210 (-) Transcript_17939:1050-1679(-)
MLDEFESVPVRALPPRGGDRLTILDEDCGTALADLLVEFQALCHVAGDLLAVLARDRIFLFLDHVVRHYGAEANLVRGERREVRTSHPVDHLPALLRKTALRVRVPLFPLARQVFQLVKPLGLVLGVAARKQLAISIHRLQRFFHSVVVEVEARRGRIQDIQHAVRRNPGAVLRAGSLLHRLVPTVIPGRLQPVHLFYCSLIDPSAFLF